MNNNLNEAFVKILKDYCDFYEEDPISFKLTVASDLSEEYKRIRPDLVDSKMINIYDKNSLPRN